MDTLSTMVTMAFQHGVRVFDSAEGYGFGSSEQRLRDATSSSTTTTPSPALVLMTKFMPVIWRWTKQSFDNSLRQSAIRLGVKAIPIYFIHTPVHPMFLSWVRWACEARQRGDVQEVGLSNCSADDVIAAVAVAKSMGQRIAANQVLYSLLDYNSNALQRMLRVCQEHQITIVAYSVLGQGLLADSLTPERYGSIRATKMLRGLSYDRLTPLRACIKSVADAHGKTMSQVCLRWAQQHGAVPLCGVRSVRQMEDALGSLGWELSSSEMKQLDEHALDICKSSSMGCWRFS